MPFCLMKIVSIYQIWTYSTLYFVSVSNFIFLEQNLLVFIKPYRRFKINSFFFLVHSWITVSFHLVVKWTSFSIKAAITATNPGEEENQVSNMEQFENEDDAVSVKRKKASKGKSEVKKLKSKKAKKVKGEVHVDV